jgi:hypothetical protein
MEQRGFSNYSIDPKEGSTEKVKIIKNIMQNQ